MWALLDAGKDHELLLLPSATHIAIDPETDAKPMRYELDFLRRSLGLP